MMGFAGAASGFFVGRTPIAGSCRADQNTCASRTIRKSDLPPGVRLRIAFRDGQAIVRHGTVVFVKLVNVLEGPARSASKLEPSFNALPDQQAAGNDDDDIGRHVESLKRNLDEQIQQKNEPYNCCNSQRGGTQNFGKSHYQAHSSRGCRLHDALVVSSPRECTRPGCTGQPILRRFRKVPTFYNRFFPWKRKNP